MSALLLVAVVAVGVMAGIYFTFSVVVMKALAQLPALQGAQAMNRINAVIVRTLFMPLFFGSTVLMAGLGMWQVFNGQASESLMIMTAAVFYVVGMFGVTAVGNVPLNNRLQSSEISNEALAHCWALYLGEWTRLNHIRTISCLASFAMLSVALLQVPASGIWR